MSDNWVVDNLENALSTWDSKLTEIWQLLTQSAVDFKGGKLWEIVLDIHGALQSIGLALLVLFFLIGVMKTCGSIAELKRPEVAIKILIRFVLAKAVITYGLKLMVALMDIVQGVISKIMEATGFSTPAPTILPAEIVTAIESCDFWSSIPLWVSASRSILLYLKHDRIMEEFEYLLFFWMRQSHSLHRKKPPWNENILFVPDLPESLFPQIQY